MSTLKLTSHTDGNIAYISSSSDDKLMERIQSIEFEIDPDNKYYPAHFAKVEIIGLEEYNENIVYRNGWKKSSKYF